MPNHTNGSPETFTCEMCRQTFQKGWTDDFGAPLATVCDDCYQELLDAKKEFARNLGEQ